MTSLALWVAAPAQAATYHVTQGSGNDANACFASQTGPGHASIKGFLQDCGASLAPGDVIIVHCAAAGGSCTYAEHIVLSEDAPYSVRSGTASSPIQIMAATGDQVTVRSSDSDYCVNSGASCPAVWAGGPDWWTVGPGFRFECGSAKKNCILLSSSSKATPGFRFTGNTVVAGPSGTNCTDQPIFFGNNQSDDVRFDGNVFDLRNCAQSFGFSGSGGKVEDNWIWEDNVFYCGSRGFCLEYDELNSPTVRRNYFEDTDTTNYRATLQNRESPYCTIENNVFYHTTGSWSSKYVMLVRGFMTGEPSSDHCVVRHNTIHGNGTEAIKTSDTPQNVRIGNNLFSGTWNRFVACSGGCGGDVTPNRFEFNSYTAQPTRAACEWASPNVCADNQLVSSSGFRATGERPYPYYDIGPGLEAAGTGQSPYASSTDFIGDAFPPAENAGAFSVEESLQGAPPPSEPPAAPRNLR